MDAEGRLSGGVRAKPPNGHLRGCGGAVAPPLKELFAKAKSGTLCCPLALAEIHWEAEDEQALLGILWDPFAIEKTNNHEYAPRALSRLSPAIF